MIAAAQLARLLEAAEATWRAEIQPHLGAEQRYPAAMVANALRICTRALVEGDAAARTERDALSALYPDGPTADLDALERRLAAELRAGGIPPARERRIRQALLARTRARLTLTNPDYLETYRE